MTINRSTKSGKPRPPTHLQLITAVLASATEPMTDEQIDEALNAAHPSGWTKAKDRVGRIGIIHRVLYKTSERARAFDLAGVEYLGPRFDLVPGPPARWKLGSAPPRVDVRPQVLDRDEHPVADANAP